jgi:hypothetical protein
MGMKTQRKWKEKIMPLTYYGVLCDSTHTNYYAIENEVICFHSRVASRCWNATAAMPYVTNASEFVVAKQHCLFMFTCCQGLDTFAVCKETVNSVHLFVMRGLLSSFSLGRHFLEFGTWWLC